MSKPPEADWFRPTVLIAGIGYEFTKHFQAGLYYAIGESSDGEAEFRHKILTLQVIAIAY